MTQENLIPFRCNISSTDTSVALGLRILLDDQVIFDQSHITENIPFECLISDVDQQHVLIFEMSGKTQAHTVVNEAGEITKDALLKLTNFSIDDIELVNVQTTFKYEHNFNGTGDKVVEPFYGSIGCNGQVIVKFSTPIYLWLLENM
jgi:hypothetical protein